MSDVVVIGGGVGSMATAIRLAARGHRVQLFERRHELGGKLTERRRDGFAFGLGPSLLTLPDLFGALAAEAGRKLDELVTLTEVDPVCRYHFPDGSILDARSDPGAMAAEVERFSPGQGQAWQRYFEWGERCWAASERAFLSGPLDLPGLARRQASLSDLFASAPGQTLAGLARRFFTDPRLIQYACRYATYSGSDPYQAPAAVGCIPYLEHARGAWYVDGGLARLRDALARLLADLGVVVHTGATVSQVLTADGQPAAGPGWPGWAGRAGAGRLAAGSAGCWWPASGSPPTSWSAARIQPGCTGISGRPGQCAAGSPGSGPRLPDSWCWPHSAGAPPGSPTTTSSSPRTTARSSRTSSAAAGRPPTRRSTWAAPRPRTRRPPRPGTRA